MADARSAATCSAASPSPRRGCRRCASSPSAVAARAVVEVGTGTGLSGLWLLRGMRPDGVLTSIDADPEHQRIARAAFTGVRARAVPAPADQRYGPRSAAPAHRRRLRPGVGRHEPGDQPRYLEEALRLLRPGGVWRCTACWGRGARPRRRRREHARAARGDPSGDATTNGWPPPSCPSGRVCWPPSEPDPAHARQVRRGRCTGAPHRPNAAILAYWAVTPFPSTTTPPWLTV